MAIRKSLVKKLDRVFSLYIRNKGSDEGFNRCYTCGAVKPVKELQCGHYVSRRFYSLRWEEKNCRPQCVRCNVFHEGNKASYALKLMNEDPNILQWLDVKKNNRTKLTNFELQELIKYYETA